MSAQSPERLELPSIKGPGFLLRPFVESDAVSLQACLNDKRVAREVTNIPFPYTIKHAREWIERTALDVRPYSKRVDFVIAINGKVAGSMSLINKERYKAQVSYWLSPEHWGKGVATEALKLLVEFGFSELDLHHIYAYVYTQNEASANVLKRAGFSFTHHYPAEWYKVIDGELQAFDSNHFGITRQRKKLNESKSYLIVTADGEQYEHLAETAHLMQNAFAECGHTASVNVDNNEHYDLVIALGGDGTMMKVVRKYSVRGIPTVGLNGGDVGFLTCADVSDWETVLQDIVAGRYVVERRMGLRLHYNQEVFGPFVNDIVVDHPRMGEFNVSLDAVEYIRHLPAKGVLVSTATGSTAQNVAVGGPVVLPDSSSVVISPISPQILSTRSLVTEVIARGGTVIIDLVRGKRDLPAEVYCDGISVREFPHGRRDGLQVGASISVSRHPQTLLFANFGNGQYPKALRDKKGFAHQ